MSDTVHGLSWKLRRVAAGLRQQDVASLVGISTTRYSAIERGEAEPSAPDLELIDRVLPRLPSQISTRTAKKKSKEHFETTPSTAGTHPNQRGNGA